MFEILQNKNFWNFLNCKFFEFSKSQIFEIFQTANFFNFTNSTVLEFLMRVYFGGSMDLEIIIRPFFTNLFFDYSHDNLPLSIDYYETSGLHFFLLLLSLSLSLFPQHQQRTNTTKYSPHECSENWRLIASACRKIKKQEKVHFVCKKRGLRWIRMYTDLWHEPTGKDAQVFISPQVYL